MKTRTKTIGAIGTAVLGTASWFLWNRTPPKNKWPECAPSINYPDRITATKGSDGLWYAQLKVKPPNAPCWMQYRAKATDTKGASSLSAPVRFYVTQ